MSEVMLKKALAGYQNLHEPELQDTCTVMEQLDQLYREWELD